MSNSKMPTITKISQTRDLQKAADGSFFTGPDGIQTFLTLEFEGREVEFEISTESFKKLTIKPSGDVASDIQ